jgi:hypothetical protein
VAFIRGEAAARGCLSLLTSRRNWVGPVADGKCVEMRGWGHADDRAGTADDRA